MRGVTLTFWVIPERAMDVLLAMRFQIASRVSTDADFCACLVGALQARPSLRSCLLETMPRWLDRFILSDLPEARRNAVSLICNIIQNDSFKESYREPCIADDLYINCPGFKSRPPDPEMTETCRHIFLSLLRIEPDLSKMLVRDGKNISAGALDDERANEYMDAVSNLIRLIPVMDVDFGPIVRLYDTLIKIRPFHPQACDCLKLIAGYQIPISRDVLLQAFPTPGKRLKNEVYPLMCRFLPHFVNILKRFPPQLDFMYPFMDNVVFAKHALTVNSTSPISDYLSMMIAHFHDDMVSLFDSRIKKYASHNFPMVLTFLDMARIKRPVMGLLAPVFSKFVNTKINVNELITKVLERNQKKAGDKEFCISLLGQEELSDEVKEKVNEYIEYIESLA
jgi:hypothetical protein